jgi:hypothetical protein
MHALAVVLIPILNEPRTHRSLVARDAAARASLESLMFRYEDADDDWKWGVATQRGFTCDWWQTGGRWRGWGRDVRGLMKKQRLHPAARPIPRFLAHDASWAADLARVRLVSALVPSAIVTRHGEWEEPSRPVPTFGTMTIRDRKAYAAWLKRIKWLMQAYSDCLAVGVDYHF